MEAKKTCSGSGQMWSSAGTPSIVVHTDLVVALA